MSRQGEQRAISDHEIQAVIDGRLDPERHAEVVAVMAEDPDLLERVETSMRQNALLREAADALVSEASPGGEQLRTTRLREQLAQRLTGRTNRFLHTARGVAAAIALFAVGWIGHDAYDAWDRPYPTYVADAAGAHDVFGEDRSYPLEFRGEHIADASRLVAAKLGHDVSVPSLDMLGLQLVGARLLGNEEGPLAQFVYENDAGNRLSLVVKPTTEPDESVPAYSMLPQGKASYWRGGGLEYAVVSRFEDEDAHKQVTEVSRALLAHAR